MHRWRHHGRMLDRADDKMAFCGTKGSGNTEQGQVVGFGRAARKHHLMDARSDQRRDMLSGLSDSLRGQAPEGVRGRGVPKIVAQKRQHGIDHFRCDGCGGVVVKVNGGSHDARSPVRKPVRRPKRRTRKAAGHDAMAEPITLTAIGSVAKPLSGARTPPRTAPCTIDITMAESISASLNARRKTLRRPVNI